MKLNAHDNTLPEHKEKPYYDYWQRPISCGQRVTEGLINEMVITLTRNLELKKDNIV